MRAAELSQYVGRSIPDLMPEGLRLLFVGINPGLVSAATGLHFARAGNRFFPALQRAGLVSTIDPAEASAQLAARGVGITNLVTRATARADELTREEFVAGRDRLCRLVARRRPTVVAIAGITAYRQAFADRSARPGRQASDIDGAELWVVSNPSGLNAHASVDSLAKEYAEVAESAGVTQAQTTSP